MTETQAAGPDTSDDLSSFEAAVRRMTWYHQVEVGLFRTLGAWASSPDEPDLEPVQRVALGIQARHHARHGELWQEQLPTAGQALADLPTPAFVDPLVEILRTAKSTPERLEALYEVVIPRLAELYETHLRMASPMTDGPIVRVLQLVLVTKPSWTTAVPSR